MSSVSRKFQFSDEITCLNAHGQNYFFVGFTLKVESARGLRDDSAANGIKFQCRSLDNNRHYEVEGKNGPWGKFGEWSGSCPLGGAVCGIQVKIESPRGPKDDTSLNDVRLYCCNDKRVCTV